MTELELEEQEQELEERLLEARFWTRRAELTGVSFPDRTIELVVIPYDTPTQVRYQGRPARETIARGAFDGLERRANRIKVNRDHRDDRVVGRAVAFHPTRTEGLVAELRISNTDLGTETLELAADGCLDASAAFRPMSDGMRWDGPGAYTVTKAWLGHVAMTPDPAYPDARVLAVRAADLGSSSTTPLLDAWRAQVAADRVASLSVDLTA